MSKQMLKEIDSLCRGAESLAAVKGILGDRLMFAQLSFYADKDQDITSQEYRMLEALGWHREGDFFWRPNAN